MNSSISIQIIPKAANDEELIAVVDKVISYIAGTGLNFFVGPTETSCEGDFDELMEVVKNCHLIAAEAGAQAVSAYIKTNYRPNGEVLTIEKKVSKYHK